MQGFGLIAGLVEGVGEVGKEDYFGADFDEFLHHLDKMFVLYCDSACVANEDGMRSKIFHGRVELISKDESDKMTLIALDMLVILRDIVL